jgi:hypothetical protein
MTTLIDNILDSVNPQYPEINNALKQNPNNLALKELEFLPKIRQTFTIFGGI